MSLTYRETMDQYKALRTTYEYIAGRKTDICRFLDVYKPKSVTFIGSGSSYFISQSFEIITKVKMGLAASVIPAGDLMLHYRSYRKLLENTLLVAVSRSGCTSELINAIQCVKRECDLPVLAVACSEGSELSKLAELSLEIPWAFDESVCQTRSVSNMYAAVTQVIAYWGGDSKVINDLDTMVKCGESFLLNNEEGLRSVGGMEWKNAVVLADGELQGIAAEGALAYKEISQIPSNYYHLLDSRHGPMVMINKDTLVIALITENEMSLQISLINDILGKGAKVVVFTDVPIKRVEGVTLCVNAGQSLDPAVQGLPFINVSQLIAYYKALQTGVNPDQPDGLSAWIKL